MAWRDVALESLDSLVARDSALRARCRVGAGDFPEWLWIVYEVQDGPGAGPHAREEGDGKGWRRAASFSMHRKDVAAAAALARSGKELPFNTSRKLLCRREVELFAARVPHPVLHGSDGAAAVGYCMFEGKYGGEGNWQCKEREEAPWFR